MYSILDLLKQDGLHPQWVATTSGDEYASPCPGCGGKDRFRSWPKQGAGGRWWCRQCGESGDLIQYLRDFRYMNYMEARRFLKLKKSRAASAVKNLGSTLPDRYSTSIIDPPPLKWQAIMQNVIDESKKQLTLPRHRPVREWLKKRGLKSGDIERYHLGWNAESFIYQRSSMELPLKNDDNGHIPMVWIPEGLVIPCFREGILQKVNIRRFVRGNLDMPPEDGKRYVMVAGSRGRVNMLLGESKDYFVMVESDLDAILLHQLAGDIVTTVALGSAANKPDYAVIEMLQKAKRILVALDKDEAGVKASHEWWEKHYSNAKRWPVQSGKDPGEAFHSGVDLRLWVRAGLPDDLVCIEDLIAPI